MRPNYKSLCWAAAAVLLAGMLQCLSWWLNFDRVSFGPKGPGTVAIQQAFGTHPFVIAANLDHIVRGLVVIILGILAFGLLMADDPYEYRRRRYARASTRIHDED